MGTYIPLEVSREGLLGVAGQVAAGPLADAVRVEALAQRRDAVGGRGRQALPVVHTQHQPQLKGQSREIF